MKAGIQLEKLFEEIIDLLYKKAWARITVVKHLKKKYDYGNSRAYGLVQEAKEYFGKFMIDNNETLLQDCIQILEENREHAKKFYNLKEVRECTKEIAKLQQLYIQKLDISSKGEKITINIIKDSDKN